MTNNNHSLVKSIKISIRNLKESYDIHNLQILGRENAETKATKLKGFINLLNGASN